MRSVALSLVFCSFIGCGTDEPERNPPPVGSAGGGPGGGVSGAGTTTDTDTDTGTGTDTALPTSTATDSGTGTTGPFPVLRGSFVDGGAGFLPEFTCRVKFHSLGEINPSTGQETGVTFNAAFVIDAYPQSFEITSDQLGGIVEVGDVGFVTAECDVDGDQVFDDNAGAYYSGLPLTQITLPASSINLAVVVL